MRKVRVMLDNKFFSEGYFHTFATFDDRLQALVEVNGLVMKYPMYTFDLIFLEPYTPPVATVPKVPLTCRYQPPISEVYFKDHTNAPKPYSPPKRLKL